MRRRPSSPRASSCATPRSGSAEEELKEKQARLAQVATAQEKTGRAQQRAKLLLATVGAVVILAGVLVAYFYQSLLAKRLELKLQHANF